MKTFTRLIVLCLVLTLAAGLIAAQETEPGEGGAIVWGNQRGSANLGSMIRLICDGTDCADVIDLMYPSLIGVDPSTAGFAPYTPDNFVTGALATGWELSDDGSSITISLRDNISWNDGTPITANDVYFTGQAMLHGDEFEMSQSFFDFGERVDSLEIIDDYTIRINLVEANCAVLSSVSMTVSPAHSFGFDADTEADFDWGSLATHPFNDDPAVSAGSFKFVRAEPGTAIYLAADQAYADAIGEGVIPEGLVYLDVPDYNVMAERLLADQADDVNYMDQPDGGVIPGLIDGGAQVYQTAGDVWHYMSLNLADPENPQPGQDEDGNFIDQGHHPILGDVRVRQAIAHSVDIDEVITSALNGAATDQPSSARGVDWTLHPTLERHAYDLDAARALLDEAGWVSTGDALVDGGDGLRTCQGCMYDEEGAEMFLTIVAPAGARTDTGVIIQASLLQIGVDVEVQTLDFNTLYDDNLQAQTYDIGIAGWGGGVPKDPDDSGFFGIAGDAPGLGWNWQSFYNEEIEEIYKYVNAGAVADGCDLDKIKEASWRAQEILLEELPYIVLYGPATAFAASPSVEGFDPMLIYGKWNADAWDIKN